jgi:hypothetical protein
VFLFCSYVCSLGMCTLIPFIYFKFWFYQFINVFGLYKSMAKANRIVMQGLILIPYIDNDDASHFRVFIWTPERFIDYAGQH